MNIALTHVYCWPEVRRGAERLFEDLAVLFASLGHRVTTVSTLVDPAAPGSQAEANCIEPVRFWRRADAPQIGRLVTPAHRFALRCFSFFRQRRFDLVYCLGHQEAAAAVLADRTRPRRQRSRVVHHAVGIPTRRYFRAVPHDGAAFALCLRAAEVAVQSRFARDCVRRGFGREPLLVYPPVRVDQFRPTPNSRSTEPVIAFVGDLNETRKGARVLAQAFAMLLADMPQARLLYCGGAAPGRRDDIVRSVPDAAARRIDFMGRVAPADIAAVYANASVVALPATWEAFGLVLVEALAAGVPVVGCRHGGIPDIIADPAIGRLFEPGEIGPDLESGNARGLATALGEALALAREPATQARCAAHAATFSWASLRPRYEALIAGRLVA